MILIYQKDKWYNMSWNITEDPLILQVIRFMQFLQEVPLASGARHDTFQNLG